MAGAAPKPSLLQAFESLKYGDYRILWISQLFSFMGMQMQMVARGLLAYQLAGNNTAVGITMLAWGIPQLAFSLVGGAVADRVNKRNVILVSQLGTGLLSLLNAVLITTGYISIPWLFGLGLAQGTLFAFNMPARQALVPELVPQSSLLNAIALNNVGMNATRVIAPAAAGVMIGLWGVESAYYTQSVMLLVVVGLTLMLPPSRSHLAGAAQRKGIVHEIGLGLKYIASSRTMMLLMLMAFVPTLLGMPYISLLPGFRDELGLGSAAYGLMFTITGIGAVIGSIGIAALTTFSRKPLLQAIMGLGYGLSLAGLGLGAIAFGFNGALVALFALGLFSTTFQTLNNTMVMAEARPEFYGRVMSVYMLTFALFPLMSAPMGILADVITPTSTFVLLGVAIAGFMVITTVISPRYTFGKTAAASHGGAPSSGFVPQANPAAAGLEAAPQAAPAPLPTAPRPAFALGRDAAPRTSLHARRPGRRDYFGGPVEVDSTRDYMGSALASLPAALPTGDAVQQASAEPIAFPGTGAYGLVTRRSAVVPVAPPRVRDYGFEAPSRPRLAAGGALPVEAGDSPIEAGDGAGARLAGPAGWPAADADSAFDPPADDFSAVGRFAPAPTEVVVAPAPALRGAAASGPMLVASLTAAMCTSALAFLVRRSARGS